MNMSHFRTIASTAIRLLFLSSLLCAVNLFQAEADKKVVGFFQYDRAFDPNGFSIDDITTDRYTHIKWAFVDIDPASGTCVQRRPQDTVQAMYPNDDPSCQCCARGLLHQFYTVKAANPHISTMLAIGGWGFTKHFSTVASTPDSRRKFVSSCMKIMLDYGMDGIDIDWEFPGSSSGKNVGPPGAVFSTQDTPNLIALSQEFRQQMESVEPKRFLLSLDVAPIPWYLDAAQTKTLDGILDWFNVMTYEFSLDGKPATRHGSQLYARPDPTQPGSAEGVDYLSLDNSAQWFLRAGVDPDHIVMGLPTYGRQYTGIVGGQEGGLFGQIRGQRDTVILYRDVHARIDAGTLVKHWDDVAQAAYASDPQGTTFITFDDVRSVKAKADYVNAKGLGGLMLWEMANDAPQPELSLAKAAYDSLIGPKELPPIGNAVGLGKVRPSYSQFCNIIETPRGVAAKRGHEMVDHSGRKGINSGIMMRVPSLFMKVSMCFITFEAFFM